MHGQLTGFKRHVRRWSLSLRLGGPYSTRGPPEAARGGTVLCLDGHVEGT